MAQCLISFGSNLGDRDSVIAQAASMVASSSMLSSFATSRLFETPPIGGPEGQEPFLNAVAACETTHSAIEILAFLQSVETELGRQRRKRWDARSIDLDVVLHGALVGGGAALVVPHPRYTARQFVLQPACDVAGHYRDPRFGWTLTQLSKHLSSGNASLALVGADAATRAWLCERLKEDHGIRVFAETIEATKMPLSIDDALTGRWKAEHRDAPVKNPAQPIDVDIDETWVSAYVPELPVEITPESTLANNLPRLIARMQRITAETCWPAPHRIWPANSQWPEYRLEVDDLNWAVTELASALDSMRCPVHPVTKDGNWWR